MTPQEAARIVDNAPWAVGTSRECNALNVLIDHARATPEPGAGAEVAEGDPSVVSDRDAGRIVDFLCARLSVEPGDLTALVLDHVPEMPSIAVGDTVTTAVELDRLPVGATVKAPAEVWPRVATKTEHGWYAPGHQGARKESSLLGARVLDLGGVTS